MKDDFINYYRDELKLSSQSNFTLIRHEDAIVATVFKITQPNSLTLILKICSREDDLLKESKFLQMFKEIIPVPLFLRFIEPKNNMPGGVLMSFLPGNLLSLEKITDNLAKETGSLLAHIHLQRTQGYGNLTNPSQLVNDPRIPFKDKFQEGIEECVGHLPQELINVCQIHFKKDLDFLLKTDGPCVIHRDYRPGNIIVEKGKVQGIIDWSSARGGFAEDDFCPLEFDEWPKSCHQSFLAGYASVRKIPNYKPVLPILSLSRAIAAVGFTVKRGTWNSTNAKLYKKNRRYLESLDNMQ